MFAAGARVLLRRSNHARPAPVALRQLPPSFLRFKSVRAAGRKAASATAGDPAPRYEIIPRPTASAASSASSSSTSSASSSTVSAAATSASALPDPTQTEGAGPSNSQHPFAAISENEAGPSTPASHSGGSASGSGEAHGSSSSTGIARNTSLPPPPISQPTALPPFMRHPFDTHAFVTYLEKSGVNSDRAQTYMESVRQMIVKRSDITKANMLGKEDQENAAYLFRAALSELRTELSVRSRNDGTALRAVSGAIQREVDQLETKMKEDVQTLKHDIEMDMNNRKSDTSTDLQAFDIAIEEINSKFTISLGDLRTEIESAKWDATRRAISIIVLLVVVGVGVTIYTSPVPEATPAKKTEAKPTIMRDMAVGTDDETDLGEVTISDEKLEKILKDRVGRLESASKAMGEAGKGKIDVDRI